MSYTIGRSYGTRNNKVPNYYVNSQNMQTPEGSGSGAGSTNQTTPSNRPSAASPPMPGTGTAPPRSTGPATTPMTPGSGSGTTPTRNSTTTTPMTPGSSMSPGRSNSPAAPSSPNVTPGSGQAPNRIGTITTPTPLGGSPTPSSGSSPAAPSSPSVTPGSGQAPSRGTTTTPMPPGSTAPSSPNITPGSRQAPNRGTITTPMPPQGSTAPSSPNVTPGSGQAPSRSNSPAAPMAPYDESIPGVPGYIPGSREGTTTTPGNPTGRQSFMPGTTSQEISPFEQLPQGSPVNTNDNNMNIPYYMYPNLQPSSTQAPRTQLFPMQQPGIPSSSGTMPPILQPGMSNAPGTMPLTMPQPGMSNTPANLPLPMRQPDMSNSPATLPLPMMPQSGIPAAPGNMSFTPANPMQTGQIPYSNIPAYQGTPNTYLTDANQYGTPMGVPLFPLYGYDNSTDLDKDADYMKHLYPRSAKMIQSEIDNECDQMEYDGSVMFDEYPDKVNLERIADRIYGKVKDMHEAPQMEAQNLYFYPTVNDDDYMRDLVSVLLFNEIFNRRRRYRSRKRWF